MKTRARGKGTTNVAAFEPLLRPLERTFIRPRELAAHWLLGTTHLCALRGRGKPPVFVRLPSGGIRYRVSDILRYEIAGTAGPLTLDQVCLALAACEALSEESRAVAQRYLAEKFPNH